MKRVGEVIRATGGVAILRSPDETHPTIGEQVIDESLAPIGTVVDIIGPTDQPYIVVVPDNQPPTNLLNTPLYVR